MSWNVAVDVLSYFNGFCPFFFVSYNSLPLVNQTSVIETRLQSDLLSLAVNFQVERCRPYFICLLGDRFGWSQTEEKKDELLNKSYDFAIENFKALGWLDDFRYSTSVTKV